LLYFEASEREAEMPRDKLNVRPYDNKQPLLLPPSVQEYLEKDDAAHVVNEVVEMIDLEPYYEKISPVGNPSYHPAMMIKVLFYAYVMGVRSSRKIEEKLHKDVGFIYLAGMQKPDFKTISEFRRENHTLLERSFKEITGLCRDLGMVDLKEVSLDGTVMKANASMARSYTEDDLDRAIKKAFEEAERIDREEDEKYGKDKRGNELPEGLRDPKERRKRIAEAVERMKEAKKKLKKEGKKKINLTDEDAQIQKDKGKKFTLGYRAQMVVDSKEQVIVAQEVTSDQSDTNQLGRMMDKVIEIVEEMRGEEDEPDEPIKFSADAGYSSGENLAMLEQEPYRGRIDAYIPDGLHQGRESGRRKGTGFSKEHFTCDPTTGEYICPAGKRLEKVGVKKVRGGLEDTYYRCRECKGCEHFGVCTRDRKGRTIRVGETGERIGMMREKLSTAEGKEIYRHRKVIVEPVFGNTKSNKGYWSFLLRGLSKVNGEHALMCIGHNLSKIAKRAKEMGLSVAQMLTESRQLAFADTS
jgi:transposase